MVLSRGWARAAPFALASVVAWGAYRTAIRPARVAALSAADAAASGLRQRLARAEALSPDFDVQEKERVTDQLAQLAAEVDRRNRSLASSDLGDQVLASLSALAAEEGVRFRRFAPEPETRASGYALRAAVVSAEGSFFDFLRFFERVAAMTPLVLIEEAAFEASGQGDGRLAARFVAVSVQVVREAPAPGDGEEG